MLLLMLGFVYEINSGALNWYNPPSFLIKNRFNILIVNKITTTINFILVLIIQLLKKRKIIFIIYLNINIILLIKTLYYLNNWDNLLINSKLQFASLGLNQSVIQITTNILVYNV